MALDTDQTQFFESILFESFGFDVQVLGFQLVAGGSINTSVKVDTDEGIFFVKWNEADRQGMFESEANGLEILRQADSIAVPEVIAHGRKFEKAYLILEYISPAEARTDFWEHFGVSLAGLHAHTHAQYGLSFNNYIGSLPQNNEFCQGGVAFFVEKRLKVQAGLALYNGEISSRLYDQFQRLYERLPAILPEEKPALLHGDLWSGNFLTGSNGLVHLIDPSVHYGNRESELAFTHLFGGFEPAFYESYADAFPMEGGFRERIPLYNLYPLMVHVNLFGSGYLSAVERTLNRFVGK